MNLNNFISLYIKKTSHFFNILKMKIFLPQNRQPNCGVECAHILAFAHIGLSLNCLSEILYFDNWTLNARSAKHNVYPDKGKHPDLKVYQDERVLRPSRQRNEI